MKRLTRAQLRRMIISEAKVLNESPSLEATLNSALLATPASPVVKALALYVVAGKALTPEAMELYDSLDPRIKTALEGLGAAVKALPGKMQESIILNIVELINDATEAID